MLPPRSVVRGWQRSVSSATVERSGDPGAASRGNGDPYTGRVTGPARADARACANAPEEILLFQLVMARIGGRGGIRTHEGPCDPWRFSRPLP